MHFLLDFFKGIAIGAGAILPGISSGVLCVVFGIYETLLNCALNFFKNIKYNFKILFPIGLGVFSGIILFGNILKYIFYAYPIQTKSVFIGLIIGSIPELLKKANSSEKDNSNQNSKIHSDYLSKSNTCSNNTSSACFNNSSSTYSSTNSNFKLQNLFFFIFSFAIGFLLVYIERKYNFSTGNNHFSFIYLLFSGYLMSAGVIIPGVSSTLILMLLGVYDAYLVSVSSLYIPFLFPLAIGLIIGSICCMKIIKLLLDKFHTQTFFSIIGFTLGSVFVLLPSISCINEAILSILCIFLGSFIVCFPLNGKA